MKQEIRNIFIVLSEDIDDCSTVTLENSIEIVQAQATLEELVHAVESLQKERDEYREALEWLSHHLRQESVTKDVIRGVLDAALSKNTNK